MIILSKLFKFKKQFMRKQKNIEMVMTFKKYWNKILKYFILVFILSNGLCLLLRWWTFMFCYFSAFISFSVVFFLFIIFYTPELNIKDGDY